MFQYESSIAILNQQDCVRHTTAEFFDACGVGVKTMETAQVVSRVFSGELEQEPVVYLCVRPGPVSAPSVAHPR